MTDLEELLSRPGLAPDLRLAVAAKVAIAPGDWERLAACVDEARNRAVPRVLFEETLLQAVLFFGFPRVVSAFEVLQRSWPAAPDATPPPAIPAEERRATGLEIFGGVYGENRDDVLAMLRSFHPEFCDFVIESAYGRVLGRPALDPRSRELLAVGALAALGQRPQLVAHARGALAYGADEIEVSEAMFVAWQDPTTVDEMMRRVRRGAR